MKNTMIIQWLDTRSVKLWKTALLNLETERMWLEVFEGTYLLPKQPSHISCSAHEQAIFTEGVMFAKIFQETTFNSDIFTYREMAYKFNIPSILFPHSRRNYEYLLYRVLWRSKDVPNTEYDSLPLSQLDKV